MGGEADEADVFVIWPLQFIHSTVHVIPGQHLSNGGRRKEEGGRRKEEI